MCPNGAAPRCSNWSWRLRFYWLEVHAPPIYSSQQIAPTFTTIDVNPTITVEISMHNSSSKTITRPMDLQATAHIMFLSDTSITPFVMDTFESCDDRSSALYVNMGGNDDNIPHSEPGTPKREAGYGGLTSTESYSQSHLKTHEDRLVPCQIHTPYDKHLFNHKNEFLVLDKKLPCHPNDANGMYWFCRVVSYTFNTDNVDSINLHGFSNNQSYTNYVRTLNPFHNQSNFVNAANINWELIYMRCPFVKIYENVKNLASERKKIPNMEVIIIDHDHDEEESIDEGDVYSRNVFVFFKCFMALFIIFALRKSKISSNLLY